MLSQFTVNIPIGATSVSFTANINDDAVIERTESVGFSILAVSAGYAIGASTTATLVILDNDSPRPFWVVATWWSLALRQTPTPAVVV